MAHPRKVEQLTTPNVAMLHYFSRDPDGIVHVQSRVDGEPWQHHVHTAEDFDQWCIMVPLNSLVAMPEAECDCDLQPGQVIEHDGRIWSHPQFA